MQEEKQLCILVVNDVPDSLDIIRQTLEHQGYTTHGAATGGEAIAFLDSRCKAGKACPDLVIIDIDLPDMRGGSLGTLVRGMYPKLPFIYLTAYGILPVFDDIAKTHGAPILHQPVSRSELIAAIEKQVADYKSRRIVGTGELVIPNFVREHIREVEQAKGAGVSEK